MFDDINAYDYNFSRHEHNILLAVEGMVRNSYINHPAEDRMTISIYSEANPNAAYDFTVHDIMALQGGGKINYLFDVMNKNSVNNAVKSHSDVLSDYTPDVIESDLNNILREAQEEQHNTDEAIPHPKEDIECNEADKLPLESVLVESEGVANHKSMFATACEICVVASIAVFSFLMR